MSKSLTSSKRVVELDGLRGVAVLLVLVNHFNKTWLPGGFVGVDIFFVLSGYVVTLSVFKRRLLNSGNTIIEFYKRRFLRILPALIVCILVTTLFSVLFIPKAWLSQSIETTGIWSIIGGSNIAQIVTNDGYFAPSSEFNPYTHTWSLGIEEQFYLLIPILLIALRPKKIAFIVGLLSIGSLIIAVATTSSNPNFAFYSLVTRFWELGVGVLLAVCSTNSYFTRQFSSFCKALGDYRSPIYLILGLSCIAASSIFQDYSVLTPWPGSLLPVAGASLVILSTFYEKTQSKFAGIVSSILSNPVFLWFGFISYALYLWHWPVIVLMKWTVGLNSIFYIVLGMVLSLILACISTYFIEKRSHSLIRFSGITVVVSGLISVLLGTSAVLGLFAYRNRITLSTVNINHRQWYAESPVSNGSDPESLTIFVVGNSHALAYGPLLQQVHQLNGWNTRIFPLGICAVGSIMRPAEQSDQCKSNIDSVLTSILSEAKPNDIVWFASLRMYRYIEQGSIEPQDLSQFIGSNRYREELSKGFNEIELLMSSLIANDLRILVDRPKPLFKAHPFRCSDWFNRSNPVCSAGLSLQKTEFLRDALGVNLAIDRLKSDFPSLIVWDPSQILCGSDQCEAMDGSNPLFFDADHLSRYGNLILLPSFDFLVKSSSAF